MTKEKSIKKFSWPTFFVVLTILLFGALVIFRGELKRNLSKNLQEYSKTKYSDKQIKSLENQYNYTNNDNKYEYTFLEFGSKGCIACKKMEAVMEYIRKTHKNINVVFYNVTEKETQKMADFYGIVTIPTQVLLDENGKEFFRHSGFISEYDLEQNFK